MQRLTTFYYTCSPLSKSSKNIPESLKKWVSFLPEKKLLKAK